ncbi:MAG TPA: hypothetical protein VGM31_19235 [Puia sp.]
MSPLNLVLHWASPVLFILLLDAETHQGINVTASAHNSFATTISPWTDYYTIRGKKIRHVDDGSSGKKFVLIRGKKKTKVDKAIQKNYVINVPSEQVIDSMTQAYLYTERTSKEEGFIVGKKGKVSIIVEGTDKDLIDSISQLALDDLAAKGDTAVYDVHTHRVRDQDSASSAPHPYGVPCASLGPDSDTNPKGFEGKTQAKVILGYEPETRYYQGGCGTMKENKTTSGDLNRTIGFYDISGTFLKLNFKKFIAISRKINSHN